MSENDPIRLGEQPDQTLQFIHRLREGVGVGAVHTWRGEIVPPIRADLLCHLPPPAGNGNGAEEWRSRFRVGLCYYRQGPGFVQIKDVRDHDTAATFVIDTPALLTGFLRCLEPTPLADLTLDQQEAAEALVNERLLLRLGDHVLTLPYRMKRWPVPAPLV
ncbi:DUF5825 family protein [Actinomadura sp. 6N118]|uniref:DUF5825 family protein n=1 Tax=Actinomadura sp. 6N118 TaxID=3375151 RepID=UPI00379C45CC